MIVLWNVITVNCARERHFRTLYNLSTYLSAVCKIYAACLYDQVILGFYEYLQHWVSSDEFKTLRYLQQNPYNQWNVNLLFCVMVSLVTFKPLLLQPWQRSSHCVQDIHQMSKKVGKIAQTGFEHISSKWLFTVKTWKLILPIRTSHGGLNGNKVKVSKNCYKNNSSHWHRTYV